MEYQRQLIERLRNSISPKINLAEELADFLDISADSAYRRLRCETAFTMDEAIAISDHYNLPDLMGGSLNAKTVSFRMNPLAMMRTVFLTIYACFLRIFNGLNRRKMQL